MLEKFFWVLKHTLKNLFPEKINRGKTLQKFFDLHFSDEQTTEELKNQVMKLKPI